MRAAPCRQVVERRGVVRVLLAQLRLGELGGAAQQRQRLRRAPLVHEQHRQVVDRARHRWVILAERALPQLERARVESLRLDERALAVAKVGQDLCCRRRQRRRRHRRRRRLRRHRRRLRPRQRATSRLRREPAPPLAAPSRRARSPDCSSPRRPRFAPRAPLSVPRRILALSRPPRSEPGRRLKERSRLAVAAERIERAAERVAHGRHVLLLALRLLRCVLEGAAQLLDRLRIPSIGRGLQALLLREDRRALDEERVAQRRRGPEAEEEEMVGWWHGRAAAPFAARRRAAGLANKIL
eukprot:scaffold71376_cov62-Phaeocystis_antarctica.AAC.2